MAPRAYNRRTPEQIVADLEAEIERQKAKLEAKQKADDPVLKEIPKLKKRLKKFAETAHANGRKDIGNSVTGFISSLDRIYKQS